MPQPFAYIPGRPPPGGAPLSRYLPPIPDGIATAWLPQVLEPGHWVLDPFGAAPRLAIEAARAGYRVLSAVNNPIARFLFELHANPPHASELRASIADLASSQKAGERLEPHIRSLYQTSCVACGHYVEAQAFVWEKGASTPVARIYTCPVCKDSGERPVNQQDIERAARFAPGELHRARALERVTPLADPDRVYAEEALEMYLPRALYVLLTLVNKLEGLPATRRRLLAALLLAAFDQANRLWASPPGRLRPRQLSPSNRYLEKNIWLSLEEAVEGWPASLAATPGSVKNPASELLEKLPLTIWPEMPPESGGVCLFEGRLKDLAGMVGPADNDKFPDLHHAAVLAALPRPNQVYWTLSALWAGWLWGHEANASFKNVLRRRRYDWNWHAEALHAALRSLAHILPVETPILGLVGEIETGFLSTALLSGASAGFDLNGVALRLPEGVAQISWSYPGPASAPNDQAFEQIDGSPSPATEHTGKDKMESPVQLVQHTAQAYLRQRGEPAAYIILHAAALQALIDAGHLPAAETGNPADLLQKTEGLIEKALNASGHFVRYGVGGRALESSHTTDAGLWWSERFQPAGIGRSSEAEKLSLISLADRVEVDVVRYLLKHPGCTAEQVDAAMCQAHPGLFTPEHELVLECLYSYGQAAGYATDVEPGLEAGRWHLRAEDSPNARRAELDEMAALVQRAGERLGYTVGSMPLGSRPAITWQMPGGTTPSLVDAQPESILASGGKRKTTRRLKAEQPLKDAPAEYWFYITASAVLHNALLAPAGEQTSPQIQRFVVLPGGRARLVALKLRRDPLLRAAAEQGWRFIKYRHLRRIAEDENLSRTNLNQLLELDPLSNSDPQLPLF